MKFIAIVAVEATNPNTGEVVKNFRVEADNGRTFKLSNTLDELKAAGTMSECLSKIRVQSGQFGEYAALPKYTVLETVSW